MNAHHWIELLEEEDFAFLKRFVLASGSLKELAQSYGISYPTVRLRLDRLIAKIQIFDNQRAMSDFERTLRALHVDGKIDLATLKNIYLPHIAKKKNRRRIMRLRSPASADRDPVDRADFRR